MLVMDSRFRGNDEEGDDRKETKSPLIPLYERGNRKRHWILDQVRDDRKDCSWIPAFAGMIKWAVMTEE
ncbi:MAG TPA: hypothetical protein VMT12_16900 [Syntrophales bacterium]|nr:hypothetical protein [Syntrophales bacterium]